MKDVTSTSFGLVIAFLLPGLAGLFALSFWFPVLTKAFTTFSAAESNIGLFFIIILASLATGLELTIIRWVLFELLLCRKLKIEPEKFAELYSEDKLESFRACVDEHYRYHQFWGSMTFVLPILYFGWIKHSLQETNGWTPLLFLLLAILLEFITILAARKSYFNFILRSNQILKGE